MIFSVDHIVSGVAINILAAGRHAVPVEGAVRGHGGRQHRAVARRSTRPGRLQRARPLGTPWRPSRSSTGSSSRDLAGILRGLLTNLSSLTLIAVLLFRLTYWVLWRTAFGLRLRSCGESPVAAESLGINVYRTKYHRGGGLRRARRRRRRVPGPGRVELLPRGPDRRTRLHRPGRHDLRQLAPRRARRRRRPCSATPTRCSCAAAGPCTRCCCWWRSCVIAVALWQLYRRRVVQGRRSRWSRASRCWRTTWPATRFPASSPASTAVRRPRCSCSRSRRNACGCRPPTGCPTAGARARMRPAR